ncbi:MAG: hypothetical protein J7K82_02200 [Thermoproteales archaeon]|nr:hypothetical protein [Thermoproteales archaeon]
MNLEKMSTLNIFLRISQWIKSEINALPLYLLLASSPLPPLTTINKLKEMKIIDFLDGIDIISSLGKECNVYSKRFKKVLNAAFKAHISGSRELLLQYFNQELKEVETSLELADYNISQIYQFVSVFTTLMPSIIASVLFFTNAQFAIVSLLIFSALSIPAGLLGLTIYPIEMHMPLREKKNLLLLLFPFFSFFILQYYNIDKPFLTSLSFTFPLSILMFFEQKRLCNILNEALELVRKASACPLNLFKCLEIDNPDYLLCGKWYGIAKASTTALYLLALYSGSNIREYVNKLEMFLSRYVETFKKLRSKTLVMLVYAFLEAIVVAVIYGILITTLEYFASLQHIGYAGVFIPSKELVMKIEMALDVVLGLNAISLSISTATCREGNPLYSPLYLPYLSSLILIGYKFAVVITPGLLGVSL